VDRSDSRLVLRNKVILAHNFYRPSIVSAQANDRFLSRPHTEELSSTFSHIVVRIIGIDKLSVLKLHSWYETSTMKNRYLFTFLVVGSLTLFQLFNLFNLHYQFDGEGLNQAELINQPEIRDLSKETLPSYGIQIKIMQEELSALKTNQAKQQEALAAHIRDLPTSSIFYSNHRFHFVLHDTGHDIYCV
jgi:hypothetical protein